MLSISDVNHAAHVRLWLIDPDVDLWRQITFTKRNVSRNNDPHRPTLTLEAPNYSIWIFTHLKLCLADAIHNFKWVKIIQIWQNGCQLLSKLAGWCHIYL